MDIATLIKLPYEYYMENVAEDFLRITGLDCSIKAAISKISECFLTAYEEGTLSEYKKDQKNKTITYYVFELDTFFKSSNERVLGYTLKNESYDSLEKPYFGMFVRRESLLRDRINGNVHIADIEFNSISDMNDFLDKLSNDCIVENWNFSSYRSSIQHPILKNYIENSYYQALFENKVCFNKNQESVCFNTGLLDPYFNELFIVCEYIIAENDTLFCYKLRNPRTIKKDNRLFGRYVVGKIPEPAYFYNDDSKLLFNSDISATEIDISNQHIFEDNIDRINDSLSSTQEKYDPATNISACVQKFKTAIAFSLALAKRNYKLIAPQFWPESGELQYLMPIYLEGKCEEQKGTAKEIALPNVALCLEKVDNIDGIRYRGTSILTLDMAYQNARLIAKPDSFWLEPDRITVSHEKSGSILNVGDIVDFKYVKEVYSKSECQNIIGLRGIVGEDEPAMLHISKLSPERVSQQELQRLKEVCTTKNISVKIIEKTSKGWGVSLIDVSPSFYDLIK